MNLFTNNIKMFSKSKSYSSHPELSIYAFPLPEADVPRKGPNARKRKGEPLGVPSPIDYPNIHEPKKLREVEFPDHFCPFLPQHQPQIHLGQREKHKRYQKRKQLVKNLRITSSEPLLNKIIESSKSNQIFKTSIPNDATIGKKPNPKAIDLSHLIKNSPLAHLVDNPFVTKMDNEIKKVVDSASVPEFTFKPILSKIIDDLNECVKVEGCTNKWNCFGSFLYGLVWGGSDIDIYYECVSDGSAVVPTGLPTKMRKWLGKSKKFYKVLYVKSARVPILKAVHFETKKELDISFSNALGVRNSLLTKFYLSLNPNLKYLILYLKHVLRKFSLHGTAKITTHILIWLVCFFMQQKNLLPAVKDVRKSAEIKTEVQGWDCSVPDVYSFKVEPVSLYSLVLEFFAFYKDFDFLNYVISPFLGYAVLLSDFERGQVATDELAVYYNRVQNNDQRSFSRWIMNIQDPTDLSFNITKQVIIWNVNRFKILCHSFSLALPNDVFELGKIESLNGIFPNRKIDFDQYKSHNLTQYATFIVQSKSLETIFDKFNHDYMLETIRKVMELVFGFDKKSVVVAENVTQNYVQDGKGTKLASSNLYLEYCSSESTWNNEYIKELVPRSENEKEQFRVYLTCEVCVEKKLIRVFVQGEGNFVEFMRAQGSKLFAFGLTEVVPA
ncbi:uncharacterized protein LOC135840028 [Planococcus citri]|uniref:uncharacterized protein LOC135840028 n=1 Tax=Planococcus citri TaxID=170843 RepID=UPI0031F7F119